MNGDTWRQVARELNSIEQLARDSTNAERITRRVERVRRLVKGKEATRKPPVKTRRRQLWGRDPRCFWCGRETNIKTENAPDSATVEHIYHRNHPKRRQQTARHLPDTVLACRRCNSERGAPEVRAHQTCPLLKSHEAGATP